MTFIGPHRKQGQGHEKSGTKARLYVYVNTKSMFREAGRVLAGFISANMIISHNQVQGKSPTVYVGSGYNRHVDLKFKGGPDIILLIRRREEVMPYLRISDRKQASPGHHLAGHIRSKDEDQARKRRMSPDLWFNVRHPRVLVLIIRLINKLILLIAASFCLICQLTGQGKTC